MVVGGSGLCRRVVTGYAVRFRESSLQRLPAGRARQFGLAPRAVP